MTQIRAPKVELVTTSHELKRVKSVNPAYVMLGGCIMCFKTEKVVALPTSVDGHGQVVICERCVKRLAKLIDYGDVRLMKAQLQDETEARMKLEQTVEQQGVIIASYEAVLGAKKKLDPSHPSPDDIPLPGMDE